MAPHRVLPQRVARHRVIDRLFRALAGVWWTVTAALLVVGSLVSLNIVTRDHLGPLVGNRAVAAGEADGAASGDVDKYPWVRYGGMDVAVLGSRPIPVNRTGYPIVVVELAVRNSTSVQARLPRKMVRLVSPTGHATLLDRFEYSQYPSRIVVEPGGIERALAVFKLTSRTATDPSGYLVQIAEQGRWPAILPLDGQVRQSSYPRQLDIVTGTGEGTDAPRPGGVAIDLVEATVALDYGVYRAPIGQHLAVITVSISGPPRSIGRTLYRGSWTLVDGMGNDRAIRATAGSSAEAGGTLTVELVFAYSTDASELELYFGEPGDGEPVARFRVQPVE